MNPLPPDTTPETMTMAQVIEAIGSCSRLTIDDVGKGQVVDLMTGHTMFDFDNLSQLCHKLKN